MFHAKKIMKDFVEGRMDTKTFYHHYINDVNISKLFIKKDKKAGFQTYYSPLIINKHFDINNAFDRYGLYDYICSYFRIKKIACNFKSEDEEFISLINYAQPSWLDVRNEQFWRGLLSQIPSEFTKSEKKKLLQEKVKELFQYETKPPYWIQNPEWPFNEKGKPLKFLKQESYGEIVKYYFYDINGEQETIIEQFS